MTISCAGTRWNTLVQWIQGQPDKTAYKCVRDVQSLIQRSTGTDLASMAWRFVSYFSTQESISAENDEFRALKERLLEYVEAVPENDALSSEQLQKIQAQIEENQTLVEMWNCTKNYYSELARKGKVDSECPDYVFGFSSSGSLVARVKAIQAQIDTLNHLRSQAFETITHWVLSKTSLTYACMPLMIQNGFTNITCLDMSYNQFEVLGDFRQLDKLTSFFLTGNCLREIPENHLPLSLIALLLNKNQLIVQPDLSRLTKLLALDLSDNSFKSRDNKKIPRSMTMDRVIF